MKLNSEARDSWFYRNLDIKNRTLFFAPWQIIEQINQDVDTDWEVNDYTVANAIKGLHILEKESTEPINLNWMSYGGDFDAGIALYDYIKTLKSYVTITCYGRVRSMGTIIMQACDERILSQNCLFMIHYGSAAYETSHAKDFGEFAKVLEKDNTTMEDIYLDKIKNKHKSYTRKKLQDLMKYDKYLTPKEAIDLGLADSILGE